MDMEEYGRDELEGAQEKRMHANHVPKEQKKAKKSLENSSTQ